MSELLTIHRSLAYLVFLVALANVVLVLTKARSDARIASVLHWSHTIGLLWAGRVTMVLGLGLWHTTGWSVGTWWIWVSLLAWGPVEALGKRKVRAETDMVRDGGRGSGGMVVGVVVQLICVIAIFGLMSAAPGS